MTVVFFLPSTRKSSSGEETRGSFEHPLIGAINCDYVTVKPDAQGPFFKA